MAAPRVEEHPLPVEVGGEAATAVLEVPGPGPRGLALLAHGLSASRESEYLREVARQLHAHSIATVSMDAPLHGSRRTEGAAMSFEDWVAAWQAFWRSGGGARMAAEYRAILDACPEELSTLPVGYWGTSLGTQTGIPWLAEDPRPRAAVLGQFRGDGLLMKRFAPDVGMPVFFIQQQGDLLHPVEVTQRLFDLIGSDQKLLRRSPGGHDAVPRSVLDESVTWLSGQLIRAGA